MSSNTSEEKRDLIINETNSIHYIIRDPIKYKYIAEFNENELENVNKFYSKLDIYNNTITPLISLKSFAKLINIKNIYIKDESLRFNLLSFKVLGGLYSIIQLLLKIYSNDLDINKINNLHYVKNIINNKSNGNINKKPIIITATDGNHGKGIAWSCQQLNIKSIIFMPKGTVKSRINNIKNVYNTSKVMVTDLNYDDTVKHVFKYAEKQNKTGDDIKYYVIQDVATNNYFEFPLFIMHGYTQIARETLFQLNNIPPTHIILQVGVGGFSSSFLSYYRNIYKNDTSKMPKIILFEPLNTASMYKTAKYNNNTLQSVDGELKTIMAGLSCGVPTKIGGDILNKYANCYIKGDDYITANGMRILANPIGNDQKIKSGESGASIGIGLLYHIMTEKCYHQLRNHLNINNNSRVLIVNTEGITDYHSWKNVVWFGQQSRL